MMLSYDKVVARIQLMYVEQRSGIARIFRLSGHSQGTRICTGAPYKKLCVHTLFLVEASSCHCKNEC